MDLQLAKKGLGFAWKNKKWVLVLAAFGFTGYGAYKVYHLPSIAQKRRRILKLLGALISIAEAVSDSSETVSIISKDLKDFLQSESDQIPNSLKQISKITKSDEFSVSLMRVTQALTMGILRGYGSKSRSADGINTNSSLMDQVMDKLFTTAGSGFASSVFGSFARNLVMAFYSDGQSSEKLGLKLNSSNSTSIDHLGLGLNPVPRWVDVVCGDECRKLIGDCIQLFVSTAVTVYLEKTMDINTYNEFFAGLTNPKHETEVKDVLVSVCNGTIETFVKTSHQVLTSSNLNSSSSSISSFPYLATDQGKGATMDELPSTELKERRSFGENEDSGWVSKVSSTLALPSNRSFVLDVTGRMTFKTVRSFLKFFLEKLYDGVKQRVNVVLDAVTENGLEVVRYITAKSSVVATICLSLCLHVLDGAWILAPA